jgi:hypothetical protein
MWNMLLFVHSTRCIMDVSRYCGVVGR